MEYKIVSTNNVEVYLKNGWKLHGTPFFAPDNDCWENCILQAIIRNNSFRARSSLG